MKAVTAIQKLAGVACFGCVYYVFFSSTLCRYRNALNQTGKAGCRFEGPPATWMKTKPSVVLVTVGSLPKGLFDAESFPKTTREIGAPGDVADGTDSVCASWDLHQSGAAGSEQGFVSLFHSVPWVTPSQIRAHRRSPEVRSWTLDALRSNGLRLLRVSSKEQRYCWSIMEECDIFERDFDEIHSAGGRSDPDDRRAIETAVQWIQRHARRDSPPPYFLSLDLQGTAFPYAFDDTGRGNNLTRFEPYLTVEETHLFNDLVAASDAEEKQLVQQKLTNRAKNSYLQLDAELSAFIRYVRRLRKSTIVVLTSEYGDELLHSASHTMSNEENKHGEVPFVMCGPNKLISSLKAGSTDATSHIDVLPSLLEAGGATLGETWTDKFDFQSFLARQKHSRRLSQRRLAFGSGSAQSSLDEGENQGEGQGQVLLKSRSWPRSHFRCWKDSDQSGQNLDWDENLDDDLVFGNFDGAEPVTGSHKVHIDASFVANRNRIDEMRVVRPTIVREWTPSPHSRFIVDVLSIGSSTREEYMHAQIGTWATHGSVRSFYGITERDDFNSSCSIMSEHEVEQHIAKCSSHEWGSSFASFVENGYTWTEGIKRIEPGWLCAQRRVARGLGILDSIYRLKDESDLPDFLIVADDDTYFDIVAFGRYLDERKYRVHSPRPEMHSGCLFRKFGYIRWEFPYGGFGTVFNREAIRLMIRPIHCDNPSDDEYVSNTCQALQRNRIGEKAAFREGMSVVQLFQEYSALNQYCLHSDWITGYMAKFYLLLLGDDTNGLRGSNSSSPSIGAMGIWPKVCGNVTQTGSIRPCFKSSGVCHRQSPRDMEYLAADSFAKSPGSYKRRPALDGTQEQNAFPTLKLPDVLLVGAQKAGTTALAAYLFSHGVCDAEVFEGEPSYYRKEVHFFDERYDEGIEFYAQRYRHCSNGTLSLDATPNTLPYAERVKSTYSAAGDSQDKTVKIIIFLRDPADREYSLYNHMVRDYSEFRKKDEWYGKVSRPDGTVKSFDEFIDSVTIPGVEEGSNYGLYSVQIRQWFQLFDRQQILILSYDEFKNDPGKILARVGAFLGKEYKGRTFLANDVKSNRDKKQKMLCGDQQRLEKLYQPFNEELFDMLSSSTGPAMEQTPFPEFNSSGCSSGSSREEEGASEKTHLNDPFADASSTHHKD